jgi:hypothetical protein
MESWLRGRSEESRFQERTGALVNAELIGSASPPASAAPSSPGNPNPSDRTRDLLLTAVLVSAAVLGLLQVMCGMLSGSIGFLGMLIGEGDASEGLTMLVLLGLGLLLNIAGVLGIVAAVGIFRRVRWGKLCALASAGFSGLQVLGGFAMIPFGMGWAEWIGVLVHAGYSILVFAVLLQPRYSQAFHPATGRSGQMFSMQ